MLMEKPNSRDVYALFTLYSQQREVIADIRTMSDLSEQANMLNELMLFRSRNIAVRGGYLFCSAQIDGRNGA